MFVQVIEGRTKDPDGVIEMTERWQKELRPGAIGYLGVTAGVTADGRTIAIVRFEDEASARANSERPEQTAWFEGMAKLYDGAPTFTESSDITEWMGGGSNDAGFVQVMKSTGVDRAQGREDGRRLRAVRQPAARHSRRPTHLDWPRFVRRRRLLHERGRGPQGREGGDARRDEGAHGRVPGEPGSRSSTST